MKQLFLLLTKAMLLVVFLFVQKGIAQESVFYCNATKSTKLIPEFEIYQEVLFDKKEIVYNQIGDFIDGKLYIATSGLYQVSGLVNINPGVFGSNVKDQIDVEVLLFFNYGTVNERVLHKTSFSFKLGNLDVSNSLLIPPTAVALQAQDVLQLFVRLLPSGTLAINKNEKYDHVNRPTGMTQIASLYIRKQKTFD